MSENLNDEADRLVLMETLARQVARIIVRQFEVEPADSLSGSRWGCMWVDDFMGLVNAVSPQNSYEYSMLTRRAHQTSKERFEGDKSREVRLAAAYSFGYLIRHEAIREFAALYE